MRGLAEAGREALQDAKRHLRDQYEHMEPNAAATAAAAATATIGWQRGAGVDVGSVGGGGFGGLQLLPVTPPYSLQVGRPVGLGEAPRRTQYILHLVIATRMPCTGAGAD